MAAGHRFTPEEVTAAKERLRLQEGRMEDVRILVYDHDHLETIKRWAEAHPDAHRRPFASALAEAIIESQAARIKDFEARIVALARGE